ncbi:ArfGap-domain-containing protein [Gautieria morchelliformis]|nr:ArfGap-domain-containing protein [Gautieria morchelliformis]
MADPATRKVLQEFASDASLKNKTCVDCGAPRPQWASISFAVLICLQCAGTHRGFGVHISFVRSISMDTWQEEQLRRMKLGGNAPFVAFLTEYPSDHSGYTEDMNPHDKYHCWAATQYREKLTAALEDKPWLPSAPPPSVESNSLDALGRPSSAQGLRKSRASTRSPSSNLRQTSNSPAPSPLSHTLESSNDRKAANESYFASLGASNASRPDHLPPSQGGRYTGFGSTPPPDPAEHLSSAAAPTLGELQSDPVRALSKGWSLFAGAVAGASRAVSENVVKPGMERVADPELREKVGGYVSSASQRAAAAAGTANAWGRTQFGVDVGESMGAVVDKVRSGVSGGPPGQGYEAVDRWDEDGHDEGSALSQDVHEDDFFKDVNAGEWQDMSTTKKPQPETAKVETKPKAEDWDEWKDF